MTTMQERIAAELAIPRSFDVDEQIEHRVAFLADYLRATGAAGYVLGISGGVDSSLAGRLCRMAVDRVRAEGVEAMFVAMRLPYHVQADEEDARAALRFVAADEELTVDIGPASDAMWQACVGAGMWEDVREDVREDMAMSAHGDFVKGNVKARARMIAQYAVAGARGMLVVGTDHAAEAVVGFFTKHGDGAVDLTPLTGLAKRRVRELARRLGAPAQLVDKVPTADLESDKPLLADEVALGVTYEAIDDYLEGLPVEPAAQETILSWYRRTAHKRALPAAPTRL